MNVTPTQARMEQPPIVLDSTKTFGAIVGFGPTYVARLCQQGKIPAARVGKSWRINRYEALRTMGLLHDEPVTSTESHA